MDILDHRIRDDLEKEDAFRGLCAMVQPFFAYFNAAILVIICVDVLRPLQVRANPLGAVSSLAYLCKAIASWHVRTLFLFLEISETRSLRYLLADFYFYLSGNKE